MTAFAPFPERFSVAPMLDVTDRHTRYFYRLLSHQAWLYTEMVVDMAAIHGDLNRFYGHDVAEHPLVLQLGGADPLTLAKATKLAQDFDFAEINLNVGCPSDRVQSGKFGACLMAEGRLVADLLRAMQDVSSRPITVKTRLGIDDLDSYGFLRDFVGTLVDAGLGKIILHARKAWLQGLSPRQNREIPPLDYARVQQVAQDFPCLFVVLNGGLTGIDEAKSAMQGVDGVMLGRAVQDHPWLLTQVDEAFYQQVSMPQTRLAVVEAYAHYVENQMLQGVPFRPLIAGLLNLYKNQPKGKLWRKALSDMAQEGKGSAQALLHLAQQMPIGKDD